MAERHPFLKSALELNLLRPEQAEAYDRSVDPRAELLAAGLLDAAACARIDEAARPVPSGRLITRRSPPAGVPPGAGRTVTLARTGDGASAAHDGAEEPGFWDAIAPLPEQVGVYRILGEVARGGMGIVIRAYHPGLDKQVAIKLLHPEAQGDPAMEERFLREARSAARLRHPGIVAVHDVARDPQGRIYLVMDLVEGESLKMRLERGPLPPQEAARLVEAVARAVGYAHAQGILHRDLKPHNVLLDERDEPLLTDFGLAKGVGEPESSKALPRAREALQPAGGHELTRTGELVGTPLYMSPEQVEPERGPTNVRSDVWALGVLLYESLTATTPFDAPTSEDVFARILRDAPEPPSRYERGVPPALDAIVLRCLERSPARRYASAEELANELAAWLRGGLTLAQPRVSPPPARGGPWPSLLLGALVLGLALIGWRDRAFWSGLMERLRGAPPPAPAPPRPDQPTPIMVPVPTPARIAPPAGGERGHEPLHSGNVARLAEEGHPDAMLAYGWALASGQLGAPDPVAGRRWMERAAEAGDPQAYSLLAMALLEGKHLAPDPAAAREWLERGAADKVLDCLLHLGQLQRDDDEPEAARRSWEEAASMGSAQAMLLLSDLLGRGPAPRDASAAFHWLERADQAGSAEAALGLGQVYERGALGQPRSLERARECYQRALERGASEARARLDALR